MRKRPEEIPIDDQSVFIEEQDLVQAPPAEISRREYLREHEEELRSKKRMGLFLFLGLVLVISSTYALLTFLQPTPAVEVVVEPTPTPLPLDPTALEAELKRLKNELRLADPLTKPLAPHQWTWMWSCNWSLMKVGY